MTVPEDLGRKDKMKQEGEPSTSGEGQGRLAVLEHNHRNLRRWVRGQVIVVLCLAGWIAYLEFIPRTVTATKFVLVDSEGRGRATLGMMEGNAVNPERHPALSIVDKEGSNSPYVSPSEMHLTAEGIYVTPVPFDKHDDAILEMGGTPGVMALSPWRGFLLSPIGGSGTAAIPVMSDGRFYLMLTRKNGVRIRLEPGETRTWEEVVDVEAK